MANRKIEYVFGPPRPRTGHSLGVSALDLSCDMLLAPQSYGTLVSGGRDGRLNAWSLSPQQTHVARVNDIHTNWVTDIVVHGPESVVSSSADTTVKHWDLKHNTVTPIGHHTDYAQCLARLSNQCVVSGGLDGALIGWNVQLGKKAFEINTNESIYSLAAIPDGSGNPNVIISGTHDGTVSVWDTRQPAFNGASGSAPTPSHASAAAVFRGHTDNVRCLYALDGDTIISGSSDCTVKIWSLRSGRIFKTLSEFHSSVWSLHPTKDNAGFWAGDRDGNIYHTPELDAEPRAVVEHACKEGGLQGLQLDPVTNNLWISTPFSPVLRSINPTNGGSTAEQLKGHSGLRKHRLLNDKRHVLVVDTAGKVEMVDLVSAKPVDFERHIDLATADVDAELNKVLEEVNTMDVLDNWCQVQIKTGEICVTLDHRSINNTEVYLDDLQNHVTQIQKTPMPTPQQSPQNTPATTPMTSPLSSPQNSGFFSQNSGFFTQNSGFFRQGRSPLVSPAVSRVTSSQSLADLTRQVTVASRHRKLGTGKGQAKFYDPEDEEEESSSQHPQTPQQPSSLRAPSLHIPQPLTPASHPPPPMPAQPTSESGNKIKINADETEEPADSQTADDEIRINLGNFVLENLFRGVVDRLKKEYDELPAPPQPAAGSVLSGNTDGHTSRASTLSPATSHTVSHSETSETSSTHGKPERRRTRFFNKIFGRRKDDDHAPPASATTSSASVAHHSATTNSASQQGGTPTSQQGASSNAGDSAVGPETNPQLIKQKHQQQQQNMADSSNFMEAWTRAVANHSLQSADPESPTPDVLSRRARLVVTEIAPGAGAPTEIYSTTVGRLIHNKSEADNIERLLPGWVGDALLLGKLNLKPPSKIGFAVLPGSSDLPELTSESTRLMAISMLRIRKIMAYTVGQLQQQKILTEEASNLPPEEIIRLTCQGTEVTALTTLATVRTRIWRKGGDVGMEYTLRKKV